MEKLAIFNSFPFHYELFGFILDYSSRNGYYLDIYTNFLNDYGYLQFYKKHFVNFGYLPFDEFKDSHKDKYSLIFLTTDDDPQFIKEWITPKVICINHYYLTRTPGFSNYLNICKFKNSTLDYSIPCYQLLNDKQLDEQLINVAIIGGRDSYDDFIINRLHSENKGIVLNFIGSKIDFSKLEVLNSNFIINTFPKQDTSQMVDILQKCNYLLISYSLNQDHEQGISSSGSLQLAFNTLCRPIISKQLNKVIGIRCALEFDNNNEPIILDSTIPMEQIVNERDYYSHKFEKIISKIIPNTAIIVEPRRITNIPAVIQNFYSVLGGEWNFVFYCGSGLKEYWLSKLKGIIPKITIHELEKNNFTADEYNKLLKSKKLYSGIKSEYILIFQSDTWLVQGGIPINNFIDLDYSYIGGNMSYRWFELDKLDIFPVYKNFNGGLSLRKTKDMLRIIDEIPDSNNYGEDVYFTVGCYSLGLPIGDTEYSSRFCNHTYITSECFGLHNSNYIDKSKLYRKYPEILNNYLF